MYFYIAMVKKTKSYSILCLKVWFCLGTDTEVWIVFRKSKYHIS